MTPPEEHTAEAGLVEALRQGDETAFTALVERYYPQMLRLAAMYVSNRTVAEDVVQEAWLGVLNGIHEFEGRSSLKTWMFRILVNRAKTRAQREGRSIPFSAGWQGNEGDEPAVEPERFLGPHHPQWPGHWATPPERWRESPEALLLSKETRSIIDSALGTLPPNQREVITMRDIEGWSSGEVCDALGISEANQRVLLHRARSKIRRALEQYLGRNRPDGHDA